MGKYIDADKLIANLERQNVDKKVIEPVIRIINSLQQEQPEVDLEKEYEAYVANDPVFGKLINRFAGITVAKHFYELGLRRAAEMYDEIEYNRQRAEEENK